LEGKIEVSLPQHAIPLKPDAAPPTGFPSAELYYAISKKQGDKEDGIKWKKGVGFWGWDKWDRGGLSVGKEGGFGCFI